jgi:hypothetical protein
LFRKGDIFLKRFWICVFTVLCSAVFLTGCLGIASEITDALQQPKPLMVSVMLQEAEGMTIKGANPVQVKAGEDVAFEVELMPGYKIDTLSNGAVYENGTITVSEVRYPTTVVPQTRTLNKFLMTVTNDPEQGKIRSSVPGGKVTEDTEITLSVIPAEGMVFLGFSLGASASAGAEIVCTTPEYTFSLTEEVEVYTNYYNVGDGRLIIYDSNGGDQPKQYDAFSNSSHYICPHALINTDYFTREGYVLYGYNTEADGSGIFYGPGWNIIMPEDESVPVTLYAQWMPATEAEAFVYTVNESQKNVTITGYTGDHESVVIPETIEGYPVASINRGAFKNCNFKSLYISKNILSVNNGAVSGCKQLETLYLCDTVRMIMDSSFEDCPNLKTLYMLACMAPRYSNSRNGNYMVKYQRLITAPGPKLIIHSGSNTSYGIDSALMEAELGNRYSVVNYGCNQDTPACFYYDVIADFINEGDIVVHAPEIRHYQWGYNEMNTTTWQIFEGAYDAFIHVDLRDYTYVFSSFNTFNASRYTMTPRSYEDYSGETVNKYGDYIKEKIGSGPIQGTINDRLAHGGAGSRDMDPSYLSQSYVANLNREFDNIKAAGGRVYITFCAVMNIDLNKASQGLARQKEYQVAVIKNVHGTVISDPGTYVMDYKYFYNSIYHLNTEGSRLRTKWLAQDILAQLAKE